MSWSYRVRELTFWTQLIPLFIREGMRPMSSLPVQQLLTATLLPAQPYRSRLSHGLTTWPLILGLYPQISTWQHSIRKQLCRPIIVSLESIIQWRSPTIRPSLIWGLYSSSIKVWYCRWEGLTRTLLPFLCRRVQTLSSMQMILNSWQIPSSALRWLSIWVVLWARLSGIRQLTASLIKQLEDTYCLTLLSTIQSLISTISSMWQSASLNQQRQQPSDRSRSDGTAHLPRAIVSAQGYTHP
jgi:hypothetical protein